MQEEKQKAFVEHHSERSLEETVPELKDYLFSGAKVLDVGCGPGTITHGVARTVSPGQVVGIDPVENNIEAAMKLAGEQNVENLTFQVGEGYALPFSDATFDIVYSHTVLHYFYDPERALREQRRVTKVGGWVVAAGVRDWGIVRRYPPCPAWEAAENARARFAESRRQKAKLENEHKMLGHTQAGRRCPEWFRNVGLQDFRMTVTPVKLEYSGAESMEPHGMDLLPWKKESAMGYLDFYQKEYDEMIKEGFLDQDTLDRAMNEASSWFEDPRAFHFHVLVFAAGRA